MPIPFGMLLKPCKTFKNEALDDLSGNIQFFEITQQVPVCGLPFRAKGRKDAKNIRDKQRESFKAEEQDWKDASHGPI